jgi:hypothetical protein
MTDDAKSWLWGVQRIADDVEGDYKPLAWSRVAERLEQEKLA